MRRSDGVEDGTRASIRRWIRTVLQEQDWSAEEWARRADTSPTNITRILAVEDFSLPNADTLARLATAAGSQPDLTSRKGKEGPHNTVPLLDRQQVLDYLNLPASQRVAYLAKMREEHPSLQILFRPSVTAFATKLETNSLSGRRIMKGDIVIIEPSDFGPGNLGVVIAALVGGKISAWLWYPPMLVPASDEDDPVPVKEAKMLGRVLQLIRSL